MRDRVQSVLGLFALGAGLWSAAQLAEANAQVTDEFTRPPVDVVHSALRPISTADADRALADVPWQLPNPRWMPEQQPPSDGLVLREGARAQFGKLSLHFVRENWSPDFGSEMSVADPDGTRLRCVHDYDGTPEFLRQTELEFRQSHDLRVTQFRCRMISWGSARGPWVEPRWAIEQVTTRERIEAFTAAHEAQLRYRRQVRWMELALGAFLALAAGGEFLLHRPRRPAPSPLPPAYRGRVLAPDDVAARWRLNPVVRARWWLSAAVVMAAIYWSVASITQVIVAGSRTGPVAAPVPAVEAIPALPVQPLCR